MNIFDIIDFTRSEILDDTLKPYGWGNKALLNHLNRAYGELCRESRCLIDSTTPEVCQVNLLSNQNMFPIHQKVVYIFGARRQSDGVKIWPKSQEYIENAISNWETVVGTPIIRIMNTQSRYLTIYPKFNSVGYVAGSGNIDFILLDNLITKDDGTFTNHFSVGDTFVVTGTVSNNDTFTVKSVTDTQIETNEDVFEETNTSAILQKVRDVAKLRVARLPLLQWTLADLEGGTPPSPEIDEVYHLGLSDGIAKFAFLKQDTETYDPKKAEFHRSIFEDFKSTVAWEIASLIEGDNICTPHDGTL